MRTINEFELSLTNEGQNCAKSRSPFWGRDA
jgi:hypothetical protein